MELVYEFLVQGTHLRVHQLLVNGQPHSEDVHLLEEMGDKSTEEDVYTIIT